MLLKVLLAALAIFSGGVGVMRASVLYENYALLAAGLTMAVVSVALATSPARTPRAA